MTYYIMGTIYTLQVFINKFNLNFLVGKDGIDIYEFYGGVMTYLRNYIPVKDKSDIRSISCFSFGYQHFLATLDFLEGIRINNFVSDYENYMYALTEKP